MRTVGIVTPRRPRRGRGSDWTYLEDNFTIANGDLDEVGGWTMQVELTKVGVRLTSDPVTRFHVGARL
jgi:hypothetical protein